MDVRVLDVKGIGTNGVAVEYEIFDGITSYGIDYVTLIVKSGETWADILPLLTDFLDTRAAKWQVSVGTARIVLRENIARIRGQPRLAEITNDAPPISVTSFPANRRLNASQATSLNTTRGGIAP